MLVSWIKDERVTAETWIYVEKTASWTRAGDLAEVQTCFRSKRGSTSGPAGGVSPLMLRRIKILAELHEAALERFARFVSLEEAPQWSVIVRQGDTGDSMYFILQGELRVKMEVMGRETILATLGPGDFFGDISLFDHGARSADVVANTDSTLGKISAAGLDALSREAPEAAAGFLRALGRGLAARIRADNKRFGDFVKFSRAAG